MTVKAEFIVNVGPYQHVAVTIEGEDWIEFNLYLDTFSDELKQKLGVFQAELESWIAPTREAVLKGELDQKVEVLKSLGATVIKETDESQLTDVELEVAARSGPDDVLQAAFSELQKRSEANAKPKPWQAKKPAGLDNF